MLFGLRQAVALGIVTWAISLPTAAQTSSDAEKKSRCDTRLSIAFLGKTQSSSADQKTQVDNYLNSPEFVERFSRFLNSKFNDEPGETSADDAPYHLAKYILENKEPYKNLFVGPYTIVAQGEGDNATAAVQPDPNGIGYFGSRPWMDRYAGNEDTGLRLVAAYRIINNTLGTELTATTNAPEADVSANGRQAAGCRGCHFDNWFALDPLAEALSRVQRDADDNVVQYIQPDATPKQLLGGETVSNEKELIEKIVSSEEFAFNSCRISFNFLYGRDENSCEGALFDKCMEAFKKSGMIQDALAAVAKDDSFCQ